MNPLLDDALAIWHAAVAAVRPAALMNSFFAIHPDLANEIRTAPRDCVVGAGKAGAAMAETFEALFPQILDRVSGLINVPSNAMRPLRRIELHAARPPASNHPTADGVTGSERMMAMLDQCSSEDLGIVLLSGGGSALLPAPANGITLADKQATTKILHACGATIQEMNCVRKHLSRVKGGGLVERFRGRRLISLIISDVVGDPLDVIASGPTSADPSTFANAIAVVEKYRIGDQIPAPVMARLRDGVRGAIAETLKSIPAHVVNHVIGNNAVALATANQVAVERGYRIQNLGSEIEGDTRQEAERLAQLVTEIKRDQRPATCILLGGETTVSLGPTPGKGGRNQEFVLAMLCALGESGMRDVVALSGGTDGEDGPTDAAGAWIDENSRSRIRAAGLDPNSHLDQHDAYPVFDAVGGLIRTGLTETNVMDVRVVLVGHPGLA